MGSVRRELIKNEHYADEYEPFSLPVSKAAA